MISKEKKTAIINEYARKQEIPVHRKFRSLF